MKVRDDNFYKMRNLWYCMIHRTTNSKHPDYFRYGARGIKVCDEWHSFASFYEDMKDGYLPGLTLDRIDNDASYAKENCRWATRKEQANNRRTNKWVTIGDITKTLEQWITASGIKSSTVRQRIYGRGWSVEKSLFTNPRKHSWRQDNE